MVDGIGPVMNIQQDYFPSTGTQEQVPVDGVRGTDQAPVKTSEEQQERYNGEQIQKAVDKMNMTMETYNTELRFTLHQKSGEYIIKVINTKDNSVIREIPPEKVLNMVAYFKEMLGFVVDKFA